MGLGSGIVCSIRLNTVLSDEEKALYQDPDTIQAILARARKVAIVGLSTDRQKASYFVGSYLKSAGFELFPIHPKAESILGFKAWPSLEAIGEPMDVVDIFRPAHEVPAIVASAIATGARAVWQQLRINNLVAARQAREAGIASIVDLCLKMEHGRYHGGLHEAGMNTELISARRSHRLY